MHLRGQKHPANYPAPVIRKLQHAHSDQPARIFYSNGLINLPLVSRSHEERDDGDGRYAADGDGAMLRLGGPRRGLTVSMPLLHQKSRLLASRPGPG